MASKASKVTAPLSVIHTNSLASINQHYSPEKKTSKPTYPSKPKGGPETKENEFKSKTKRRSSGKVKTRTSPRISNEMLCKNSRNQRQEYFDNNENAVPAVETVCEVIGMKENFCVPERKQSLPKPQIPVEEKVPRKKMRRSNTYSNVSGFGLTVPIIQGEQVKGHKDTSLLHLDECNVSGIKPLADSIEQEPEDCGMPNQPSFLPTPVKITENKDAEPSFLEPKTEKLVVYHCEQVKTRCVNGVEEPSFLVSKNASSHASDDPSFLTSSTTGQNVHSVQKNQRIELLKTQKDSFQDSLDGPCETSTSDQPELPSFLVQQGKDENTKPDKPRRSLRRSGKFTADNDVPTEKRLLRSIKRRSNRQVVSPDSFLKEIQSKHNESTSSSHKPLNDSLGQSSILEQLKNIKSFIHEKSFEIERSGNGSMLAETSRSEAELQNKEHFLSKCSVPEDIVMRRGTFVTAPENLKLLETQKPSEASPRRTTFTVIKETEKVKVMKRSKSEGSSSTSQGRASVYDNKMKLDTLQEGNSTVDVDDQEVKQETVMMSGSRVDKPETLQRLFSADSLENESSEERFESPSKIPVEQCELQGRRATLTVTKSRPSDALLGHIQKTGGRPLFGVSESDSQCESGRSVKRGVLEQTENTSVRSVQNSTFEVSKESFPSTPGVLPTSPNPDHSRRSTHVIQQTRVLDLGTADRKQLFVPEVTSVGNDDAAEELHEQDRETKEMTSVGNVIALDKPNEKTAEVKKTERTSVSNVDAAEKIHEQDSETKEQAAQLFFIALDKPEEKTAEVKKTERKLPQHFLRKRSNPVQQAEDAKVKRQRAEVPSVRERQDMANTRPNANTRKMVAETILVPKSKTEAGVVGNKRKSSGETSCITHYLI